MFANVYYNPRQSGGKTGGLHEACSDGGRLTARRVATAGPGEYTDGNGLYLCVSASGARSWVYRFSWRSRRPEMGLGSFIDVSLNEARTARDEARQVLRSGRNPIEARRQAIKAASERQTFGEPLLCVRVQLMKSTPRRFLRSSSQFGLKSQRPLPGFEGASRRF
jgi:hypothetical protein